MLHPSTTTSPSPVLLLRALLLRLLARLQPLLLLRPVVHVPGSVRLGGWRGCGLTSCHGGCAPEELRARGPEGEGDVRDALAGRVLGGAPDALCGRGWRWGAAPDELGGRG